MEEALGYVLRVPAGLEATVGIDISRHITFDSITNTHRTIHIQSKENPEEFLKLRSVDDVFLKIGEFTNIDASRASLSEIYQQSLKLKFTKYIKIVSGIRSLVPEKGFSITCSFIGRRNFNRWELADSIKDAVNESIKLPFLSSKEESLPDHDIHFRIHLENNAGWCGIRLAQSPLFKRTYKISHVKGSLSPQIAYTMVRLAEPQPGDILIDPMCGAGTIPIEASYFDNLQIRGFDIDVEKINVAKTNLSAHFNNVTFEQADARKLPVQNNIFDCLVSDLPWGGQTKLLDSNQEVNSLNYQELLEEFSRILTKNGRMVLLTEKEELLTEAILKVGLTINKQIKLSLYGKHPVIFILTH